MVDAAMVVVSEESDSFILLQMNHYKHACPNCGQHIDYTDGYAGREMPCPMCGHPLLFPAVPAAKLTTSLRLQRDIPKPERKTSFNFLGPLIILREFKHWKIVGICLLPFVLVAGGLLAASHFRGAEQAAAAVPDAVVVDPQALHQLTDLTRADMLVQAKVAAVNKAFEACAAAKRNHASAAVIQRDDATLLAARKSFEPAFANYQKLGGVVDYRQQLP
jgi:DNA-directed RNA polymerase subunit RPC12/RpoP